MTWGRDHAQGAEEYIQANPDDFEWDGSVLMPYGTSVWGASATSALSDCDYVIAGAFMGGLIGFVNEYKTAEYDGTFVITDQNVGFWSTYVANCGRENLNGTLWPHNGRYWSVDGDYVGDLLTNTIIAEYCTDEEKAYFENQPTAGTVWIMLYYITELLREAVNQADSIDDIDGELLYDIAQTMTIEIEGYPTLGFTDTVRALLHYTRVYEYNAQINDFSRLGADEWITIPGFE